jgi:hypothetical protein
MRDFKDRFAVIGAGPTGLGLAKALKTHSIPYDQFEADDHLGGNWYHGVYSTTHTISSKTVTQYTDFPMPATYPDYPSRKQMLTYLEDYARHFDLTGNISFGVKVLMARPAPGGRWEVTLSTGETRVYKGLVVSNGHDWSRRYPEYQGNFSGEILHSKDYKVTAQLTGKRVLVIGAGNSACDIATEAARVGKSSDLSIRHGYWFVPKVLFGRPFHEAFPIYAPLWIQRILLRMTLRMVVGDYSRYGLPRPDHNILDRVPTINSELLDYLRHGRVKPRPGVLHYDGDCVTFTDGSTASYDLIVCATGFNLEFPFFAKGFVPIRDGVAPLYADVLLPEHKNLYLTNALHPIYGFGPPITVGGELLVVMIRIQDRIELPLGRVIQALGIKPATTHLAPPGPVMRRMRWARRLLPVVVPLIEPRLRRRLARQSQAIPPEDVREPLNHELNVY